MALMSREGQEGKLVQKEDIEEVNGHLMSPVTMQPSKTRGSIHKQIGYFDVLKIPRAAFGFGTAILCLNLWTYLDTTLAYKLEQDFKLSSNIISIIYSFQMLGFLPTSFLVPKLIHSIGIERHHLFTLLVGGGFLLQGLGTFLIGPSALFSLPNTLKVIIAGLLLTGVGGTFTSIGSYQEMQMGYYQNQSIRKSISATDQDRLNDLLAGLFQASQSLGYIIGPLAGSYLTIWTGSFSKCSDIFAIITLLFATA